MKIVAVYVAQESRANLEHGLRVGIWGFTDEAKPDGFSELETGDLILLGSGYSGGAPRTTPEKWQKNKLANIWCATITGMPFRSIQPEWSNEASLPEGARYVHRVKFDPSTVRDLTNVPLGDTTIMSAALSDSFRKSGCVQGKGYILDAAEFTAHRQLFVQRPRFWVEKTLVSGRPDRESGPNAMGVALWSPQKSEGGTDIYRAMTEVQPGDVVFHLVDNQGVAGYSIVDANVDSSFVGLPETDWAGRPGYRVTLSSYRKFDPGIDRKEFLGEPRYRHILEELLGSTKRLFFNRELNLNQGAYLTEAPLKLVQILNDVFEKRSGGPINPDWNLPPLVLEEGFKALLQRYHDAKVVFKSSAEHARYAIESCDESGVFVARLGGGKSARVTFDFATRHIELVKERGSLDFVSLDYTSAVRNTILQAKELVLSGDGKLIQHVENNEACLRNFLDVLDHLNAPTPYKPAMLLSVVEAIESNELTENKITFEWIAPRFISTMRLLGAEVDEQNAAQPFYHLTGDLFWMHAVRDLNDLMHDGSDGPVAARKKVKYAILKDTYWNLLRDQSSRAVILQKLKENLHMMPQRNYWAGGFGEAERLKAFLSECSWKLGWPETDKSSAAQRCWDSFRKVRVGDGFAIKGYGGRNHLNVHLVGEVEAIDVDTAEIKIKPWDIPHFAGEAPQVGGGGNWFLALTPVASPKAIEVIFGKNDSTQVEEPPAQYTIEEAEAELFMERAEIEKALKQLNGRKSIILQGPPGVGKSYAARRLAYLKIGAKDEKRFEMVQFHPNTTYDDFVYGLRPDGNGGFCAKPGVFHRFCARAAEDPNNDYVFVIDELNRANLAKVFGELMMLLEADKRGIEHALPLLGGDPEMRFFVPENVFLIGTMNTADRSLALVDYALRRRFAFINMRPEYGDRFARELVDKFSRSEEIVKKIRLRIGQLNRLIESEARSLGKGYLIGHSFFCGFRGEIDSDIWYREVVTNEIRPLLEEYWMDDPKKAEEEVAKLLA